MLNSELGVCITQKIPRGWTDILKGSFADPQFDPQGATDLFCYNHNTGTGAFFVTAKNGQFDDGTPLLDRQSKVGGNHRFISRWTHIVFIPILAIAFPAPHINKLLLFYDAASGLAEVYEADGCGNINLKKQHRGWRTSWTHIIAGQFGRSNLLFYDSPNSVGEFYYINGSGEIQLIESWS